MSHSPERKERDCLNCGATLHGRYCHVCGQENIVPKETFWSMFLHFFYDITHFDSKFFLTVKDLVFRPGFLSKEFIKGRRARYLHPVRMYMFTSAVFFLLFFSFFKPKTSINTNLNTPMSRVERVKMINDIQESLKGAPANANFQKELELLKDTTRPVTMMELNPFSDSTNFITLGHQSYRNKEEYDSIQNNLQPPQRDGWFKRRLIKKAFEINDKYRENPNGLMNEFGESILHRLPYMLFVTLPLFALILKLLYIRRKQFYYADHGAFTIHFYIFSFLLLLLIFSLSALRDATHWNFINVINLLFYLAWFFYLYKAMRNFYQQKRFKTFMKFILVTFCSFIMMLIVFVFFIFFSAVTL